MIALFCSSVVSAQEWKSSLQPALEEADSSGKNVFLFFSVADACETCKALEEKVLLTEVFKNFASDKYVLAKIDFTSDVSLEEKAENLLIVEKYNKDGFFPWVVIINKSGKILGKTGLYNNESPEEYIRKLQSLERS
jgi:thiol:disulfide interchange protein